jgi:DNA-binding NarL/FixJ family response regulator
VERTRIVLVDTSPLLRDIIRETANSGRGFEVVADVSDEDDVWETVERTGAELVIVGPEAPDGTCAAIVGSQRVVRVVELDHDGCSVLYELMPTRVGLGDLSPEALLSRVRVDRSDQ